jgi:hypothetical protein
MPGSPAHKRANQQRRNPAPNTAQFAVKQVVGGSTKTITVADQLHLSRFAGDIGGRSCRDAMKISE